jgi:type VI secretion system secreted protein Hcp
VSIDSYMYFQDYNGNYLASESQVDFSKDQANAIGNPFIKAAGAGNVFEIQDYSFDIEQILNIGSQSRGAGAGKITFNPFSITRAIDKASPVLFTMACSGTAFQSVGLGFRKGSGGTSAGSFFLSFTFKLVAVKTISWSHDDESPKETTTFGYGGLQIWYGIQNPNGSISPTNLQGWNAVKNTADVTNAAIT